jgi:hypothetical protein
METTRVVGPTREERRVRTAEGQVLEVPAGWVLLPPGDAGLTRRVKAAGPTWTVQEKVGRKLFSRGVWAPPANVERARAGLEAERATPAYAKKREADARRRAAEQAEYEVDFANAILAFLRFAPAFAREAKLMAVAVAAHATPVGSGTVARTERIPLEERARAAVIAWMRHQTTGYDDMRIARVKGARREVRRELADVSRALLDTHRRDVPHPPQACPLCTALSRLQRPAG